MLGFELDFWDYMSFASLAAAGVAFVLIVLFIGGLPGRIAIARKHPDAEAVNVMGWAGLLAVVAGLADVSATAASSNSFASLLPGSSRTVVCR